MNFEPHPALPTTDSPSPITDTAPLITPPSIPMHPASQRHPQIYYWKMDPTNAGARCTTGPTVAATDKPLVFYFGGVPVMNIINERPSYGICNEIGGYLKKIPPENYQFIIMAESSGNNPVAKFESIQKYNQDPQHYASANAQEFVDDTLMPMLKDAKSFDEVKKQFSRVNLIGHSYGTVFIQNVSNALSKALTERTRLTEEQRAEAMRCISALNIAPVCIVTEKPSDFTQLFAFSAHDKTTKEFIMPETLVSTQHPVLAHQKTGSSLVLLSQSMGTHLLKLVAYPPTIEDGSSPDPDGHSLRLYMNTTGNMEDKQLRTFQVNPSAAILREFLDRAMETSIDSVRKGIPRDMGIIMQEIETHALTADAKIQIARQLDDDKRVMSKFILASALHRGH